MSQYNFKGVLLTGEEISGERSSSSPGKLRDRLSDEGIIVTEIREHSRKKLVPPLRSRSELVSFTRQMAVMLRNGMRLDSIIRVLLRQQNSRSWSAVLTKLSLSLNDGNSLSASMAQQSQQFDRFYISLVEAGESSGELAEVFSRLARSLETSDRLRRKIVTALAYPAVIMVVAALVLFILLFYIVPVFKEMFLNFRTELPTITSFVVGFSDLLISNPLTVPLLLLGAAIVFILALRSRVAVGIIASFPLRIPGLRSLIIKSETSAFARTQATLLFGGVSLSQALALSCAVVKNARLRREFEHAVPAITTGSTLHSAWNSSKLIPPMVAEMVAVGEETGELAKMFESIADFYSDEVETLLPTITAVVEPLLIVIVGVFVAVILISMYLPLFELIGQLG